MATVKAEVVIKGTIELPATKETDEEMEYTIEQAKKSPEEIFDDIVMTHKARHLHKYSRSYVS